MNAAPTRCAVRTLLVDDSQQVRQRLRAMIDECANVTVIGEEDSVAGALAAIERDPPDAVVLDLQLPDGLGYTVLESIRRKNMACKVIVMTQHAEPEHRSRCLRLGADHFLSKSTDFEQLLELLNRDATVDGASGSDGAAANLAQATLDSLTSRVAVLDEAGTIATVNDAWRRREAVARANHDALLVGADFLSACEAEAQHGAPGMQAFAVSLRSMLQGTLARCDAEIAGDKSPQARWSMARVTPLALPGPPRFVVTLIDITARKRIGEAMRASQERWQLAVEASGDGLWETNLRTGHTQYSAQWHTLLGLNQGDVNSLPDEWISLIHEDDWDEVLTGYTACTEGRAAQCSSEARLRHADGTWKWFAVRGLVAERDNDGMPQRMIFTCKDIASRKGAEANRDLQQAQMLESQKMEAVGLLASSIAHDFNNVVGAILGNAAVVRQDMRADHPAHASLNQIIKAASRARSLVQKVLSFSRRRPPAMTSQPIGGVVAESIDLLRATLPSGVQLQSSLCETALIAKVDASQISQMLMNLGINAWHALQGAPGQVEIGLQPLEVDAASSTAGLEPGSYAHLWVRDDGCGMDEAVRARIFEPFFTTKRSGMGTGLGLHVVSAIVQAHYGAVRIDSTPGQGTTVDIFLPAKIGDPHESAESPLTSPAALEASSDGALVLVIDDDEIMVQLAAQLLSRAGFTVTCEMNANLALETIRATPQAFDVVVSDLNMPVRSGLEIAREVRTIRPDLPVIIATGGLTDELAARAHEQGVAGLVGKERLLEDLANEVRRVLATPLASRQH